MGTKRWVASSAENTEEIRRCFMVLNLFCRTLPAKHLEEIANQFRTHNINALLVIGGFEVCHIPDTFRLNFVSIFDPTMTTIVV